MATPDGRQWTFKLREDVTWSDGNPVTANDIEYSVKRAVMPEGLGIDYSSAASRRAACEASSITPWNSFPNRTGKASPVRSPSSRAAAVTWVAPSA